MSTPYTTHSNPDGPKSLAPYSPAVVHNGTVYCSGSIALVPETSKIVEGGIEAETELCLQHLFGTLKAAGSDKSHVLKTTVFIADMSEFGRMNAVYERLFAPYKPARSCFQVAALPFNARVEVECVAVVKAAL